MPFPDPRSGLDRLVSLCLRLLGCAIAVYIAIHLVLAVTWPLLDIVSVVAIAGSALAFLRYRSRGW